LFVFHLDLVFFGFSGFGFLLVFLVFWIFVLHLDIGIDHDVKMHKISPGSIVIRSFAFDARRLVMEARFSVIKVD
jgi:hypothetical protein